MSEEAQKPTIGIIRHNGPWRPGVLLVIAAVLAAFTFLATFASAPAWNNTAESTVIWALAPAVLAFGITGGIGLFSHKLDDDTLRRTQIHTAWALALAALINVSGWLLNNITGAISTSPAIAVSLISCTAGAAAGLLVTFLPNPAKHTVGTNYAPVVTSAIASASLTSAVALHLNGTVPILAGVTGALAVTAVTSLTAEAAYSGRLRVIEVHRRYENYLHNLVEERDQKIRDLAAAIHNGPLQQTAALALELSMVSDNERIPAKDTRNQISDANASLRAVLDLACPPPVDVRETAKTLAKALGNLLPGGITVRISPRTWDSLDYQEQRAIVSGVQEIAVHYSGWARTKAIAVAERADSLVIEVTGETALFPVENFSFSLATTTRTQPVMHVTKAVPRPEQHVFYFQPRPLHPGKAPHLTLPEPQASW